MKLYSQTVSSLNYDGEQIKKNKDGSFDVPDEFAAHAQEAFGLKPTADEAKLDAAVKQAQKEE